MAINSPEVTRFLFCFVFYSLYRHYALTFAFTFIFLAGNVTFKCTIPF